MISKFILNEFCNLLIGLGQYLYIFGIFCCGILKVFFWLFEKIIILLWNLLLFILSKFYSKSKTNTKNSSTNKVTNKVDAKVSNNKDLVYKDIVVTIYVPKSYAKKILKDDEFNYEMFGLESYDCPYIEEFDYDDHYTFTMYEDGCDYAGKIAYLIMEYTNGKAYCTVGYDEKNTIYKYTYKDNKIFVDGYSEKEIDKKTNRLIKEFKELYEHLDNYFVLSEDENRYDKVDNIFKQYNTDYCCLDDIKKFIDDRDIVTLEWLIIENYLGIGKIAKENCVLEDKPLVFVEEYIEEESRKGTGFLESIFSKKEKDKDELSWKDREFEKEAKLWGLSEEDKRIAKEERMSPADFVEAEERDDDELVTDEWEK